MLGHQQFDEIGFRAIVAKHWKYHRPARNRLWSFEQLENGVTKIEVSPIYQQFGGGPLDGLSVAAAYSMNLTGLMNEFGVEVTEIGFRSLCSECTKIPFVGLRGTFNGLPFVAMIYLEPVEDEAVEIIDTFTEEIRLKQLL